MRSGYVPCSWDEGGLVPKLVWRVKLVAELRPGVTTEVEVARIERDEQADVADLGLRLDEAKRLTALETVHSATINSSCRLWRTLPCHGSTTSATHPSIG